MGLVSKQSPTRANDRGGGLHFTEMHTRKVVETLGKEKKDRVIAEVSNCLIRVVSSLLPQFNRQPGNSRVSDYLNFQLNSVILS